MPRQGSPTKAKAGRAAPRSGGAIIRLPLTNRVERAFNEGVKHYRPALDRLAAD